MKLNTVVVIIIVAFITACSSTMTSKMIGTTHINPDTIVNLKVGQLEDYWVSIPTPPKQYKKRPAWAPKGYGEWVQITTIDSNGNEVERILISSIPTGFMTQDQLDAMPMKQYKAALSNSQKLPVRFLESLEIIPNTAAKG
mmetsp:Transcript_27905/g.36021  ORF Transcript_27905/g.36021 Transcript_27905/m.36021 type:complete len:141 (-) Transcript_27905:360-782(-)